MTQLAFVLSGGMVVWKPAPATAPDTAWLPHHTTEHHGEDVTCNGFSQEMAACSAAGSGRYTGYSIMESTVPRPPATLRNLHHWMDGGVASVATVL